MRNYVRNGLAIVVSLAFHSPLLFLLPSQLKLGKNIPVMTYPVRMRVEFVQAKKEVVRPSPRLNDLSSIKHSISVEPPAAMPEGEIKHDEQIYLDIRERYFKASQLDIHPVMQRSPELGESDVSPTREGEATIKLYINEYGSVDWMEIEDSNLPESMVNKLQSDRHLLQFTPAKKEGLDVKCIVVFKITLARKSMAIPTTNEMQKPLESLK